MEKVECELQTNSLHVGPLKRRCDVHVHIQEPEWIKVSLLLSRNVFQPIELVIDLRWNQCDRGRSTELLYSPTHGTSMLSLLNLKLRQQLNKPFKTLLVPVDPEKVNLK